ncbi:Hypothetical_protein [Hexamita inflata]|uniref:Hypothetical_protein n=1 Tax=Hexamita inflata TaxID=28002 RepID=A0ABP1KY62_9EUKA
MYIMTCQRSENYYICIILLISSRAQIYCSKLQNAQNARFVTCGVQSDINKHKEQYQEEYKNYFINQVNENVKSILQKGVDVYEEIKKVVSKKQIVCKFSKLTLTEASK